MLCSLYHAPPKNSSTAFERKKQECHHKARVEINGFAALALWWHSYYAAIKG